MIPYIPIWKKTPFLRLLLPLMIGIILQWQFQFPVSFAWYIFSISFLLSFLNFLLPEFERFKWRSITGIAFTLVFLSLGSLLTWYKDIRHHAGWFGNYRAEKNRVEIKLAEPLVEKANSYKAIATVTKISSGDKIFSACGKLIVYFQKDSSILKLDEGSRIIFSKPLQEIKNAGNPGGFDYKRYSLFQGITHQVYLGQNDFVLLAGKQKNFRSSLLSTIRQRTLKILRKNIPGEKEAGLAEALLIGYKDDLDQNLVQSYTNTGVVHIIAISGLHLGLIYWLLARLLKPVRKRKKLKWLSALLIIICLWLFSLVAGAQASVVRSAVMFTCIVLGETISKKISIYNALSVSAFILLCYDPFWLWDIGFQLSYAAVLGIVIFMKPIYNLFYIKNKILDGIWKLNAVSIAAQPLTMPLSIYYFHQFPNFFLFTNFVAVPLSSIIVLGEIFLCVVSFIPFPALLTGKIISRLIWLMNSYIERIEALPCSLWDGLQINILQTIFLFLTIAGFSYWLLEKRKAGIWMGLLSTTIFFGLRSFSLYRSDHQQKIIVYNVPKHRAIDIIDQRNYFFIGDSVLLADDFIKNFHLKPSRVMHRIEAAELPQNFKQQKNFLRFKDKNILLMDGETETSPLKTKLVIDLLIISKNARLNLPKLLGVFDIKQVVFDGSTPAWKIKYWEKDCDSFHIPCFNVQEKGAFVMTLH